MVLMIKEFAMPRRVDVLKIALAILLCAGAGDHSHGQTCQGCVCHGSAEVHPVASPDECYQGCSVLESVCETGDIVPTVSVIGLAFSGRPKSLPKSCKILTIPAEGELTGKPASGCPNPDPGK